MKPFSEAVLDILVAGAGLVCVVVALWLLVQSVIGASIIAHVGS